MVKSIHPANKELHAYGGHFLVGEYSPARRSPSLPAIPARASAHPATAIKVRPRYPRLSVELEQEDITRIPTMPQSRAIWQFDIADVDTVPPLLSSPLGKRAARASAFHPIENVRWWLIQPGRLEFLIWLLGTVLLIGLTVLFVLFVLSSLGYIAIH